MYWVCFYGIFKNKEHKYVYDYYGSYSTSFASLGLVETV
jgi:hypothetical protein